MPVVEGTPSFAFNLKTNIWMQFSGNMFRHSVMCRDGRVPRESEGECFITVYMCLFALHWPEPDLKTSLHARSQLLSCYDYTLHSDNWLYCYEWKINKLGVLMNGTNKNRAKTNNKTTSSFFIPACFLKWEMFKE